MAGTLEQDGSTSQTQQQSNSNATVTVKVYRPVTASSSKAGSSSQSLATPDLPDSYFSPTTHELAVAFQGQSKKRQDLTEGPLLTKRLRDEKAQAAQAAKRRKYPNTRIRVKFPDQTQIETSFNSLETFPAVYAFVRSALREDAKDAPFVLYQTPPRREFKLADPKVKGVSLLDLDLAPSSMLYIKFDQETFNDRARAPPLLDNLLATQEDLPPPPTFDDTSTSQSVEAPAKEKGKMPKWLNKTIGKKNGP